MLYLTQTDTTVGFLSVDRASIAKAKNRDINQPFLITLSSLDKQKRLVRTPSRFKNMVRRSKKTTFLYPNKKAIRVVRDTPHSNFLDKFDFLYSSSANKHGCLFDYSFAYERADIIVEDREGFLQKSASSFYKLGKKKILKLR
jgi:tRNA A37 threonylcarbamoyladenosine synthetase subunit TsaC/SUA5/YrdC